MMLWFSLRSTMIHLFGEFIIQVLLTVSALFMP